MMIEIKDWSSDAVLYRSEAAETIKQAIEEAVKNRASLDRARLDGASLDGASLDRARLDPIKADLWMVLAYARNEVSGLLEKLRAGQINGSQYQGDCACLVGTIANIRQCHHNEVPNIKPDSSRSSEIWFMAIRPGDKPDNHQIAKITEGWIEEWLALHPDLATMGRAIPRKEVSTKK